MGEAICTLTVEATRDKPFGDSIEDWEPDTANSDFILDRMSEVFGTVGRPPGHVPYQLCHRAASAIYETDRFNGGSGVMSAATFSSRMRTRTKTGSATLHTWLDATDLSGAVIDVGSARRR